MPTFTHTPPHDCCIPANSFSDQRSVYPYFYIKFILTHALKLNYFKNRKVIRNSIL